MRKIIARAYALLLASVLAFSLAGCAAPASDVHAGAGGGAVAVAASEAAAGVVEGGEYADKDTVALYVHEFGRLPSNYVSKTKARAAGWASSEGNLWDVLPGKNIGGSEYHNDDGQLPGAPGRRWTECDVGYSGGFRGPERIVFSNDGLVYYTPDHYRTFERLY